jgi:hypothetical protein
MKKPLLTAIGAVLIVLGAVVLFRGMSFQKTETVLQIGELKAQVQRDAPIPAWAGVASLVGGLVLVVVSLKR